MLPSFPSQQPARVAWLVCRDRIAVSTLRCGRSNPGSNPGHGTHVLTFNKLKKDSKY